MEFRSTHIHIHTAYVTHSLSFIIMVYDKALGLRVFVCVMEGNEVRKATILLNIEPLYYHEIVITNLS